ncbi:MAG: metallophosphoesterase family protein, partial [Actinomycetota bacterium]
MSLGPLFLARLGDWVEAHTSPFLLAADAEELQGSGDAERAGLRWPDSMPEVPPFEPLETPDPDPPGDVIFRFAILADMHIGSSAGEDRTRAAIADINASGADLAIQLGDITDHGEREEFERAREVLAGFEIPVTTMMGNHDVFSINEQRLSGREYYGATFGREPDGLLIEHKGFRLAVLDSIEHGASPFGPFDLVSGKFLESSGGAVVRGSLTPPQHDLLAEIAEPDGPPAFIFMHHPPQPFTSFPPIIFGLRDEDSGRLHATIDSGNVWGVFAGHTHRNARTRTYGDVPAQEVGIPRDFPFGYAFVDVTRRGYAYRFHQLSDQDLLRDAYAAAGAIHRRYGAGPELSRSFSWMSAERPSS